MSYIILGFIWIYACFKFGDWKSWKLYYPTILYYLVGDLSCKILTYNYPLWILQGFLGKNIFNDYFVTVVYFPCIIILYLSNYPDQLIKKIIHITFYVFILSSIEFIARFSGKIIYYNGWNLMWNTLFYFIMFIMIRLHYKKPFLTWFISMLLAFAVLFIFKIPFETIK